MTIVASVTTPLVIPAQQHWSALSWLLTATPLLSKQASDAFQAPNYKPSVFSFSPTEQLAINAWLSQLDHEHLANTIGCIQEEGKPPLRLGRYAEKLLMYFLEHGPTHKLLAAHLPLREDNPVGDRTTRGEIDYLLMSASGERLHWEQAVKFFLCHPTHPADSTVVASQFIGPNGKDSLDKKLDKMFGRQLQQKPPTPWHLESWQPQAYVSGWMFYPLQVLSTAIPQCAVLHPQHHHGSWLKVNAVESLPDGVYIQLPRIRWIAPAKLLLTDRPLHREQLSAYLQQVWREEPNAPASRMFARIAAGTGEECERYFICPN
jgi:uncharacterized protein